MTVSIARTATAPNQFCTLVDLLHEQALHHPHQTAYTFLQDGEVEAGTLTYGDLDRLAQAIAVELRQRVQLGDRALLLYPSGLEFIAAFFGCLYAGVIAVPAYPPRANQNLNRLHAIVHDADAAIALTTQTLLPNLQRRWQETSETLTWLATDAVTRDRAASWQPPQLTSESLAFLQYTSGSTGKPKGVMVSHGNLLHNEEQIKQGFGHTETTISLGWLPLFHDMGLVGNVLQPLYLGQSCTLMSPVDFLQKPYRWLQAISRYRATSSGGPNFAYDLCTRKITDAQLATLDLSCWDVAFTGAEPIRAETLDAFAEKFAPCGFRRSAFYPCYGMAEATLFITGGLKRHLPRIETFDAIALTQNQAIVVPQHSRIEADRPFSDTIAAIVPPTGQIHSQSTRDSTSERANSLDSQRSHVIHSQTPYPLTDVRQGILETPDRSTPTDKSLQLVGCGHAWLNQTLRIVHPDIHKACPDGQVGEIWVRGGSVTQGYWNQPELSDHTFNARIADSGEGPFLRTGDLGFVHQGDLFVTGRLKDVVIIRGRNHYPQDIELTLEQTAAPIRQSCTAAFALDIEGEERLIVVAEVERDRRRQAPTDWEPMIRQLRQAIAEQHELQVYAIALLRTGTIPKTSSGKIQRHACRNRWLNGSLDTVHVWIEGQSIAASQAAEIPAPAPTIAPQPGDNSQSAIQTWLAAQLARELKLSPSEIQLTAPITSYGLDSVQAVSLIADLEEWLGCRLSPELFDEYTTIAALSHYLVQHLNTCEPVTSDAIAPPAWSGIAQKILWTGIAKPLYHTGFQFSVRGTEHIPVNQPYLIAANHNSHLDFGAITLAFWSEIDRLYTAAANDYFFDRPLKAWLSSHLLNLIPFERAGNFLDGLHRCQEVLTPRSPILVFPEGTRSRSGELQTFQPGLGLLALRLNLPIVPVYLEGTYQALPKGQTWPRRHPIRVSIGAPIVPESRSQQAAHPAERESCQFVVNQVRQAIVQLRAEALDAARQPCRR